MDKKRIEKWANGKNDNNDENGQTKKWTNGKNYENAQRVDKKWAKIGKK